MAIINWSRRQKDLMKWLSLFNQQRKTAQGNIYCSGPTSSTVNKVIQSKTQYYFLLILLDTHYWKIC